MTPRDQMLALLGSLGFSEAAAVALVDQQLLNKWETLLELDDDAVDNLCRTVRKPGGGEDGHQIPEMAMTRLQLLVFYAKHLDRIQRKYEITGSNATNITPNLARITPYKAQKTLEKDWLKNNPEPKYEPMALDGSRAAIAFDQAGVILRRIRGATGVPLSYVIRHSLRAPYNDRPCGEPNSPYGTYDEEMVARAPILKNPNDYYDMDADADDTEETLIKLEREGPWHPAFLPDTKKVWSVLHALWGKTSAWTHVKSYDKTQNGRQVYRALHNLFFGGNKVRSMGTAVHNTLNSLSYTGDTKNYNFDKYVTEHVKQHNIASSLEEFGGTPLDEARKIDMFITGIRCSDFDATKNSINANPQRFTDFDSVKDHFIEFRRLQSANKPAAASRSVSSTTSAGRGRGGGRGRGAGRGDGNSGGRGSGKKFGSESARKSGLPDQADVDRQTHITKRYYPPDEYATLTKAEKQRLWQLNNPGKRPGSDDTNAKRVRISATESTSMGAESDDNASLFPDTDDERKPPNGNRDNSALNRNGKRSA